MSSIRRFTLLLLCLVAFAPAALLAGVIVFKDGETLVTEGPYRRQGDKVFVTLQSGAETSFPVSEIDLEKTDEMNRKTRGSGVVLDTIEDEDAPRAPERTLRDVLRERPSESRLESAPAADDTARTVRRTTTGNVDLFSLPRRPVTPSARNERIVALLRQHGLHSAEPYQGTKPNRVLIDVVTAARGEVFSALESCAAALIDLRAQFPEIEALELAMATSARSRAGQFVLTPDEAQALVSDAVTPAEHFVAKVLF